MTTTRKCQRILHTDSWSSHKCNRDATEQSGEEWICKVHAAADRRVKKNRERWEGEQREDEAIRAEARKIGRELGVKVEAEYDIWHRRYVRVGVVSFEDLRKIIERLEAK